MQGVGSARELPVCEKHEISVFSVAHNRFKDTHVFLEYRFGIIFKRTDGITGDLSDIGLAESKWGYSNVSTGAGVVAAPAVSGIIYSALITYIPGVTL